MNAIVIRKTAQNFTLYDFETKKEILAYTRKKVKLDKNIMIGDKVEYQFCDNTYVIENIVDRKNWIKRPLVANIDYLFIIQSVKEPEISSYLLNKFLMFYESFNIDKVVIVFTKMDLLNQEEKIEVNKIIQTYTNDNYICLDSNKQEDIDAIKTIFDKNIIACLAGQSGVGKSTLINKLIPNLNITTQNISKALNRGKHTTTTSSLISFRNGFFVDTPGFSSIEIDMNDQEIATSYNDFRKNATLCKFSNCLHNNEKGCKIKELVDENKISKQRYMDYLKILSQNANYKVKYNNKK